MKTPITSKLLRRCLMLAVMILGLVYVASSDTYVQPVAAAPCCEQCPGQGDAATAGDECGYSCTILYATGQVSSWQQCYDNCINSAFNCYAHCTFCNSNGPGGDCNSQGDCPVHYFCGADNTCQHD
jgi:hypothetical protein